MLWLCITLPRLPFHALSLKDTEYVAVTSVTGCMRRIVVASRNAEKLGFAPGMHFVTASTLCAALKSIDRNSRAERKALDRLAIWAYQWSSGVVAQLADANCLQESSCLWLEIAASFNLFGGRAALLSHIENGLKQLGHDYRLGIAHSLEGAALLARGNRRIVVDSDAALRRQLRTLPINLLSLPEAVLCDVRSAGIRSAHELTQLPRDAIARRFGPKVNDYLDRVLGIVPDPRPIFQLPKKYRASCEFSAEITAVEPLLFPLRRMLDELQGYLRAIDGGLQRFVIHLRHRRASTRVVIGMSAPERNSERFFSLVRERFERVSLPQPVIGIGLQADRFTPPAVKQSQLFPGAQQNGEHFQQLLDKLVARLGENAVHSYRLAADHRPEKAWRIAPADARNIEMPLSAPRPAWLLSEPRPITAPVPLTTPERIEGGWWDNDDTQRDYYFMRSSDGSIYWIYRDLRSDRWFLHGLCG